MDNSRWKRVKRIFREALDRYGEEREAFVAAECGDDPELLDRVSALLAAHGQAGEFLDEPPTIDVGLSEALDEGAGATIDRYALGEILGEGGFGVVYRAEQQEPVQRTVALKIIKLGMDTRQVIARFEAERQALALMDHPNIAHVLDAGSTATGRPYFVMELVRGMPITEYCDRNRLATRERLELFEQVCHAVQHAHQKGILHRDLKPSNILVTERDGNVVPKVIDFGIAKALHKRLTEKTLFTEYGHFVGTPAYMSPEQVEMDGVDVDTRSDVYALGVLLYELLTGATPFEARELREAGLDEMRRIIREEDPPKPSARLGTSGAAKNDVANLHRTDATTLERRIRGDLDWIVMRALEKDRTRRYATPNDLAADLRRHLAHEPVSAGPPSAAYRARKFLRRHRLGASVAAIIAFTLVSGLAAATWGLVEARKANTRATREAATAEQTSDFLVGLFELSDPSEARGNSITVREVLDTGVEKIQNELADQPEVRARMLFTMGNVYSKLGLLDDAVPLLEDTVDLETELDIGAESHTPVSLAWLYTKLNRWDDAERVIRATLERRRRRLGEGHPDTAYALAHLGNLYRNRNRFDEAEKVMEQALDTLEAKVGPDDRRRQSAQVNLSLVYSVRGRSEEATRMAGDAFQRAVETQGPDHPGTMVDRGVLAQILRESARYDEAEHLLLENLSITRRVLGERHRLYQESLLELGRVYYATARYDEAVPVYRELVERSRDVFGEAHQYTRWGKTGLGESYLEMGRFEDAEAILESDLEIGRSKEDVPTAETFRTLTLLATLYDRSNQPNRARSVVRDLRKAAAESAVVDPAAKDAYARLLLTCEADLRDAAAALEVALEVDRMTRSGNPVFLETLAIAWQLTGDGARASETLHRALARVPPKGTEFKKRLEARLKGIDEDDENDAELRSRPSFGLDDQPGHEET